MSCSNKHPPLMFCHLHHWLKLLGTCYLLQFMVMFHLSVHLWSFVCDYFQWFDSGWIKTFILVVMWLEFSSIKYIFKLVFLNFWVRGLNFNIFFIGCLCLSSMLSITKHFHVSLTSWLTITRKVSRRKLAGQYQT